MVVSMAGGCLWWAVLRFCVRHLEPVEAGMGLLMWVPPHWRPLSLMASLLNSLSNTDGVTDPRVTVSLTYLFLQRLRAECPCVLGAVCQGMPLRTESRLLVSRTSPPGRGERQHVQEKCPRC